jgi:hypothetical protein
LIVVSEDRIIFSLFFNASHFAPPQTSEPMMAMTEEGADKKAWH